MMGRVADVDEVWHPQTRIRLGPNQDRRTEGARTWVGYGVLAHNLVKISALTA
jgi:hypothetical protein